jgi:phospholipase D1/2
MEENSGVKFVEAQVALARQWVSGDSLSAQKEVIMGQPQDETLFPSDKAQETIKVPIPADDIAAKALVERFQAGAQNLRSDDPVSDTVSQHLLQDRTTLADEKWLGTKEEELYA